MIKPKIKLQEDWPGEFKVPDKRSFEEISANFEKYYYCLIDPQNRFSIRKYFGEGIGLKQSQNKLRKAFSLREKDTDFQGIYVFFIQDEPIYTGISKVILKRIQQHVKGTSHFTSSLCYKMGADYHKELKGEAHDGGRKGLCFKTYSEPFKEKLRDEGQVAILEILSPIELYLLECYMAIELKTHYYNRFETH